MKINILYDFKREPHGGGRQFLATLRQELKKQDHYTDIPAHADAIIYNSYHCLIDVVRLKMKHPDKLFIHRLGPLFHLHRTKSWRIIDNLILTTTNIISDTVVWQSKWALEQARQLNYRQQQPYTIIGNASDSRYFNQSQQQPLHPQQPIKLIACSWSTNPNKGFALYHYLDNNLNFNKYAMTFIGRTPTRFRHIKQLGVLSPPAVAATLKQHHIFISGIKNDAHSNTLVEAIACGLPIVALSNGANKEIVKQGGELFSSPADAIDKITKVANHYHAYQANISPPDISHITKQYLQVIARTADRKILTSQRKIVTLYAQLVLTSLFLNILSKLGMNVPPGFRRCCIYEI